MSSDMAKLLHAINLMIIFDGKDSTIRLGTLRDVIEQLTSEDKEEKDGL